MTAPPAEAPADAPAPETPAETPPAPAAAPPAPVTAVADPPAPVPAAPVTPKPEPDWQAEVRKAQQEITKLRQEFQQVTAERDRWKSHSRTQETRSKTNHQELLKRDSVLRQIAEKVGVEFDESPDPETLTKALDEARTQARQSAIELAVYQGASGTQVDPSALLDSRDFMGRTAALDPSAADFPQQLADLVREAAGQPRYQFVQPPKPDPEPAAAPVLAPPAPVPAAAPPAASSGANFAGAPPGDGQWTQADYEAYMSTANREDRNGVKLAKAIDEGRLVNLGIGRPKTNQRR